MNAADRARVLIVDDEPALRRALARTLLPDFEVLTAEDGGSGLGLLATTHVDVVLLDLSMPRMSGAEVLARLKEAHEDVEVVVMAADSEIEAAAAAVRAGAYGFLAKPIDEGPAAAITLERAIERQRLLRRARALEARLGQYERLGELAELPYAKAKERTIDAFDRAYVEQVMARADGNISEAARQAGIDRSNFRRLRKKVGAKGSEDVAGLHDVQRVQRSAVDAACSPGPRDTEDAEDRGGQDEP